ncbi:MAG: carboxypeptidase regulatory-like domain-containing protein [Candidatus Riflebacteria bacterium]|nr:carboxypeptidase regulatory-like domain-containing protein [Candidatus Riflebacteria bacterium]
MQEPLKKVELKQSISFLIMLCSLAILIGCLGLGGGGGGNEVTGVSTSGNGLVKGRVYFSDRGLYGGIPVEAKNSQGNVVSTVTTDSKGNFVFSDLQQGVYDLFATDGESETKFASTVPVNAGSESDFPLVSILSISSLNISAISSSSAKVYFLSNQFCNSEVQAQASGATSTIKLVSNGQLKEHVYSFSNLLPSTRYLLKIILRSDDKQEYTFSGGSFITASAIGPTNLGFSINQGDIETKSSVVTLSLPADNATEMRIGQTEDLSDASWEAYSSSKQVTLSPEIGTRRLYAQFRDSQGNLSPVLNDSILYSGGKTGYIGVWIENGAAATNKTSVTLSLFFPGAQQMRISENSTFANSFWEFYSDTRKWQFTGGDGTKAIYVQFKGGGADSNDTYSAKIDLDTGGTSVTLQINQGAKITNNPKVSLSFSSAKPPTQMQIQNEISSFAAGLSWLNYTASRSWDLQWHDNLDDGVKTVYAIFLDRFGNTFGPISASIQVDTIPPQNASFTINGGAKQTGSLNVSLALIASGANNMIVANSSSFQGAKLEPFASQKDWSLGGYGTQTVYVQFFDSASNSSDILNRSIYVSTPASDTPLVFINGGDPTTDRLKVNLQFIATDAQKIRISQDQTFQNASDSPFAASISWNLSKTAGLQNVFVRFEYSNGFFLFASSSITLIGPSSASISLIDSEPVASPVVNLNTFAINASEMLVSENLNDLDNEKLFETYSTTKIYKINAFSGKHRIWAKFRNPGLAECTPVFVEFTASFPISISNLSPTIKINNGDPVTYRSNVTINVIASGQSLMWLANDGVFTGVTSRAPTDAPWVLPAQTATRTVFARFQNTTGDFAFAQSSIYAAGPASPSISTRDSLPLNSNYINLDIKADGASDMIISEDPLAMTTSTGWIPYQTAYVFPIKQTGVLQRTIYAKFKNTGSDGIESLPANLAIQVRNTAPASNTATFRFGLSSNLPGINTLSAASFPIYLHFDINDASTASVAYKFTNSGDPPPASNTLTVLAAPVSPIQLRYDNPFSNKSGVYNLWYKFSDAMGNWTTFQIATIEITTPVPVIKINNDDVITTSRKVVIGVNAPGQSLMRLSENGAFADASDRAPATTSYSFLSPQTATRTVFARFQNSNGDFSFAQDSIFAAGPASPSISSRDSLPLNSNYVNLDLKADGASDMIISENSSAMLATTGWILFQTPYVFPINPTGPLQRTVYAKFKTTGPDGVESLPANLAIQVRNSAPASNTALFRTGPSISLPEITSIGVASLPVYLHFGISDSSTASVSYKIANSGDPAPDAAALTILGVPVSPIAMNFNKQAGVYNLWYKFSDALGNTTPYQISTIEVTNPPPLIKINHDDQITYSKNVTINVTAPGQSLMWLSSDGNFSGLTPVSPIDSPWIFPDQTATRTVYARFQNSAGDYTFAQDSIFAAGPASPSISTKDTQPLNSNYVNLDLWADHLPTDNLLMVVSEDPSNASWTSFETPHVFPISPTGALQRTIYSKFKLSGVDKIESSQVSLTIQVRNTPPSNNTATFRLGPSGSSQQVDAVGVGSLPVYLQFSISDANTSSVLYGFANSGASAPASLTVKTVPVPPLPLYYDTTFNNRSGVYNLWYKFSDAVGNITPFQISTIEIQGPSLNISPGDMALRATDSPQQFTANLKNISGTVVWTLSPDNGLNGNINPKSGLVTTYTPPPANLISNSLVTITAKVQDSVPLVSNSVVITLVPEVNIQLSESSFTLSENISKTIIATFSNSISLPGGGTVRLNPASPNGGTVSISSAVTSTPVTSQIATITYTAPATIPNPNPVSLIVTSNNDPTKSASAAITITAGAWLNVNPSSVELKLKSGKKDIIAQTSETNATMTWYSNSVFFDSAKTQQATTTLPTGSPPVHKITVYAPNDYPVSAPGTWNVLASFTPLSPPAPDVVQTIPVTLDAPVSVAISPLTNEIWIGTSSSLVFSATVTNASTSQVNWEFKNSATSTWTSAGGGTAWGDGALTNAGVYTPPATYPNSDPLKNLINIRAVSLEDLISNSVATVTLLPPLQIKIFEGYSNSGRLATEATATLEVGSNQFFAEVDNLQSGQNQTVSWFVEDIAGGNTTYGTVDSTGKYTSPDLRVKDYVNLKAVSNQFPGIYQTCKIYLIDFWTPRSNNLLTNTNATFSIYCSLIDQTTASTAPKLLFCGTNGNGIWDASVLYDNASKTVNWDNVLWNGTTLSTQGIGEGGNFVINKLAISLQHPQRLVAATSDGLYASADGGATFGQLAIPDTIRKGVTYFGPFTRVFSGVAIDPVDDHYLYAAGKNQGVIRYKWSDVLATYSYDGTLLDDQTGFNEIFYDPAQTWYDVADNATLTYQIPREDSAYASGSIQVNCMAIDSQNPEVLYIGVSNYLVSLNPNTYWDGYIKFNSARKSEYVKNSLTVFCIGSPPPSVTNPKTFGGFFRAESPYIARNLGGLVLSFAVDPNTPSTLWAGKNDGIFRTTDDGSNWISMANYTNVRDVLIDPINTINTYIGTEAGLYRSPDAGKTWKQIKTGLEGHSTINSLSLSPGGWGFRRIFSGTTAGIYMGVTTLDF